MILWEHIEPQVIFIPWDANVTTTWSTTFLWTLLGNTTLRFSKQPYRCQNWSAIIWDLIHVTSKSLIKGQRRGSNLNSLMSIVNEFNDFNDYNNYSKMVKNGEGGMPMLLILIQDREVKL